MVNILLVEDNELHAEKIRYYSDQLDYNIVGIADNYNSAISQFHSLLPDIVLIDIQLNGEKTGLDVAAYIRQESSIPIIYISSIRSKEKLLQAKETNPNAYLLKPIEMGQLEVSINLALFGPPTVDTKKIEEIKQQTIHADAILNKSIFIKIGKKLKKIDIEAIQFVEAGSDKYSSIIVEGRDFKVRKTLTHLETILPTPNFIRVHRSFIVNKLYISDIHESNQKLTLGSRVIPIGKSYRHSLLARLNILS